MDFMLGCLSNLCLLLVFLQFLYRSVGIVAIRVAEHAPAGFSRLRLQDALALSVLVLGHVDHFVRVCQDHVVRVDELAVGLLSW